MVYPAGNHTSSGRSRARGRSLLELMVGVGLICVALGLAIRLAPEASAGVKVETLGREFQTAARYARSEALARGVRVAICPIADRHGSPPTCSTRADMSQGWLVFVDEVDAPGNVPGELDPPHDAPLRVLRGDAAVTVTPSHADAQRWIAFDPRGTLIGPSGPLALELRFCWNGAASAVALGTRGSAALTSGRC
jgi:type IV fimbrial biogenesis protein FimT